MRSRKKPTHLGRAAQECVELNATGQERLHVRVRSLSRVILLLQVLGADGCGEQCAERES